MISNRVLFYISQLFVAISYVLAFVVLGNIIDFELPFKLPFDVQNFDFILIPFFLVFPFIQLIRIIQYKSKFHLYLVLLVLTLSLIPGIRRLMFSISRLIEWCKFGFSQYSSYPPSVFRDDLLVLLMILTSIYIIQSKLYTKLYKIRRYKLLLYLPLMIFCGVVFFIVYKYFFTTESFNLFR